MPPPALYPLPASVRTGRARVSLPREPELVFPGAWAARIQPGARWLADQLSQRWRRPVRLRAVDGLPGAELSAEGYRLYITPEGFDCEAPDPAGLFHAWTTLLQWPVDTKGTWSTGLIEDTPVFADRGFMLDISRCKIPTRERLLELIDQLARLKINQLQLYSEHTFTFAGHEEVWRGSGALTPDELLELDQYCADRFIELVPNFNSFGHFERWLKHPRYQPLAECPNGYDTPWGTHRSIGSTLAPEPEALALLDELYGQLLPQFRSRRFNIGCDETWELGQGRSAARCQREGRGHVYRAFVQQLHQLAQRHGRDPMIWGDILLAEPAHLEDLPHPLTTLAWGYEADHPFAEQAEALARSGMPFILCPGTSTWRSLTGRTDNTVKNLRATARHAEAHGAAGLLLTDWGDCGHHQPDPLRWGPLTYFAGLAWHPKRNASWASALAAANELWAKDRDHQTLPWIADLGNVYRLLKPAVTNSTPFQHALFQRQHSPDRVRAIPAEAWHTAGEELAVLRERLRDIRPTGPDAGLIRQECRLALDFARAATRRAQGLHGDRRAEAAAQRALPGLMERHRTVWRGRNRRGGLAESVGYLRRER